ncbi:MAG: hypothetical protein ACYTXA_17315 [Nostoc sp.]
MQNQSGNLADSSPDNALQSADDTPDITLQSADSRPDSNICPADSMAHDRQNSDFFSKISILELQKKYNIGRDSLYSRMRYLQITTYKVKGKAYLDAGQVLQMDALHDHIQATGKMEGYPIPEPSRPVEEQPIQSTTIQRQQPTAAITISQVSAADQPPLLSGNQLQQLNSVEARQHDNSEIEAIASLVRNAQSQATGLLIAENMLAQQFIQNPEQLPEELRTKIQQSAAMPEVDPLEYANALVSFANKSAAAIGSGAVV